jgi:hypothetical protein
MKSYALFCMDTFYPTGGADDFAGYFDSIEEAVAYGKTRGNTHAQVAEVETMRVVEEWTWRRVR